MSANTLWDVRVRKSYTEVIQVSAVTSEEAYEKARVAPGVVMVESVARNDPNQEAGDTEE